METALGQIARRSGKVFLKALGWALRLGVISIILGLGYCAYTSVPPKEVEILDAYENHASEYSQLKELALQDRPISVASFGESFSRSGAFDFAPAELKGISEARALKYKKLMNEAGAMRLDVFEDGSVQFLLKRWGPAHEGWRFGLIWRTSEPENLADSLDTSPRENGERDYRRINESWYAWSVFVN